jgi:hypothetical protein
MVSWPGLLYDGFDRLVDILDMLSVFVFGAFPIMRAFGDSETTRLDG